MGIYQKLSQYFKRLNFIDLLFYIKVEGVLKGMNILVVINMMNSTDESCLH